MSRNGSGLYRRPVLCVTRQEPQPNRLASTDEVAPLLLAARAVALPADDDEGKAFGRGKRPRTGASMKE